MFHQDLQEAQVEAFLQVLQEAQVGVQVEALAAVLLQEVQAALFLDREETRRKTK